MSEEKYIPFQVPATISKISTMANSLRLSIDTQDTLSAEAMENLFNLYNKLGWLSFSVHQIEAESLIDLPELKTDSTKSPSQRLRGCLFRLWEQDNNGFNSFENFYNDWMDRLIDRVKEKLS